jgi:flagellar M-ring protein FliF
MSAFFENIRSQFSQYSRAQKVGLVVCGVLAMGTLWGAVHFANRIDYQLLYSDLDPQEAQGIIQKLQDAKIEFQLSDDGRSVKIPSSKISETRIRLASEGLPSSGRIGFEVFDQTTFGLTNFQEQVNYQRALEGELARSIMTLSEVAAARVHLVLPKDSLFQSAEDQAKASVILKLKNGRSLSESAVQGIVNVVASSVKGLVAERVTLIDYRGKVLSRPAEKGPLTTQQLDVRQRMENDLATKVTQILEPAVGAGKVRPQVSVLMNFQQVEETSERYDPQSVVVRSQQKQEERQPVPRAVGGIPGPRASVTPQTDSSAQTAQVVAPVPPPDATKASEVINYEVSKSIRRTVEPVGQITQISVAAIIDNHARTITGNDGTTSVQSEPRTPEEMSKYRDLIAAAVGFNMERGDRITVENISFESEDNFTAEPTFIERQGPVIVTGLRYLVVPIIFVLLYFLFLRPVQKTVLAHWAAGAPAQLLRGEPQAPITLRQLEAQLQSGSDPYAPSVGRELTLPPHMAKIELIRNRLAEQAQRDPETMARLVRTWMAGEKNR